MRIALLLGILLVAMSSAAAEPVVLAVDKGTIYVEVGARDGVGAGSELELLHAITVRDPRSGQVVRDHFALGTLRIVKSGERISIARADEELAKRVAAGDRVRVLSPRRGFEDPWKKQVATSRGAIHAPPPPAPMTRQAAVDHAELARAAWVETLGKTPEHRIERWLELLRVDPNGPYRNAIQLEIQSLKSQIAHRDAALTKARSGRTDDRAPRIAALAEEVARGGTGSLVMANQLPRALPGQPVHLAFLVRTPAAVQKAWLYVKAEGEPGFRRLELAADGDAYLRGTIDGKQVRGAAVQWYVELVAPNGQAYEGVGSREQPERIAIDAGVDEAPIRQGRSHIDAHVDYVDFDGKLGKGFDQYYQAEADFTYRFLTPVHAVRLGFGTLSGTGGPKDVIDQGNDCMDGSGTFRCRNVNFSYVYTEFEFKLRKNVALLVRPQAGLLSTDTSANTTDGRCRNSSDIDGCTFFTGLGMRARLRLGEETGTNLVLGAGFTQNVGTLLEAAYHWLPTRMVPVQLTVQVTDMPVPEDFGVRLIGDVGLRHPSMSWFYPSLRLSYQARDIDHAGISGGLAMNFDW